MSTQSLMRPVVGQQMAVFDAGSNPFINRTKAEGVIDGTYLRFNGNEGRYISSGTEIDVDSEVVMDLFNCKLCWQGFDDENKPHRGAEVLFRSGEELPEPDTTNPKIRWAKILKVALMTLEGGELLYSAKADRPSREIWKLLKKYGAEMMRNVDDHNQYKVPVIKLGARSFSMMIDEPQKDGSNRKIKVTKYAESFEIVGWMTQDEVAALLLPSNPATAAEQEMIVVEHQEPEIIPPPSKVTALPPQKAPKAGMPFTRVKKA